MEMQFNRSATCELYLERFLPEEIVAPKTLTPKQENASLHETAIELLEDAAMKHQTNMEIKYRHRARIWEIKIGFLKESHNDFTKATANILQRLYNIQLK